MHKYCSYTTINHQIVANDKTHLEEINDIFQTEGYKGPNLFAKNIKVINLDKFEIANAKSQKRNRCHTVDLTFGISRQDQRKSPMMVLVELRFKYINPYNLDKSELEKKVVYSKGIISNNPPICEQKIFVFQNEIKNTARYVLSRFFRNKLNSFRAVDAAELAQIYF